MHLLISLWGYEKGGKYMRYEWIDEYLLSKKGVTKDLQKDWNWIRYQIGGKMFAAVCLGQNDEPYYITLKLEPSEGDFLRTQYEDIIPGYYMNKIHWNSIKPDGEVPDDLLKDLLDKSYQLVLGGFSKKKQREILENTALENTVLENAALENTVPEEELSCCGTECKKCGCYGNMCKGCNESLGKVFHAPKGQACPIYECSINMKKYKGCGECSSIPCDIWRRTKDPSFSDEEFEQNIKERVNRLKRG